MQRTVHYFAPVSTDFLNKKFGSRRNVGAASNKAFGVCNALLSQGVRVRLVSGVVRRDSLREAVQTIVRKVGKVRLFLVSSYGQGVVLRVFNSIGFLLYSIRHVNPGEPVIIYNFFPEYILSVCILKIRRIEVLLDIEDAPRNDELGLRGHVNRCSFRVFRALCSRRCLTVSEVLAQSLKLEECLVVYGVTPSGVYCSPKTVRFGSPKIRFLFGGTIVKDTGIEVFCGALKLLKTSKYQSGLKFIVSGTFDAGVMQALRDDVCSSSEIEFELMRDVSREDYIYILSQVDVGICLKLSSSSIGSTTFPSKVIEYAANGILVCSTSVSDVPKIFTDKSAILLKGESSRELANAIECIAANPEIASKIALRGRQIAYDRFSTNAVGAALVPFLYD